MGIKRIIFDLDNTLIDWKDEYSSAIAKTFEQLNIKYTKQDVEAIDNAILIYESGIFLTYKKEDMQKTFEKELGHTLPKEFIDICLKNFAECVPEQIELNTIKTLEYLKEKYDLVVLTNWFKKGQVERLRKTNILKFFTEVYAPEDFPMKPNKESFNMARGKFKIEECLMVGDDIKIDIEGALDAGMKAIYLNKRNNQVLTLSNKNFIKTIHNLSELMFML